MGSTHVADALHISVFISRNGCSIVEIDDIAWQCMTLLNGRDLKAEVRL